MISRISNEPLTMLGIEVPQQNYWESSFTQMFKNYIHLLIKWLERIWWAIAACIQQVLLPDRQRPQSNLIPVQNFPDHLGGHRRVHCECKNKHVHLLHSHFYLDVKGVESLVLWPYNQELKGQARFLRQQEYWPSYFASNYWSMGVQGLVGGCVLLSDFISERKRVGCTGIGLFHA